MRPRQRVAILGCLLACACVEPAPDESIDGGHRADAAAPRDGGPGADGGSTVSDASLDGGASSDAGGPSDGGAPSDVGAPSDGGAPSDSGDAPFDAGSLPDAGPRCATDRTATDQEDDSPGAQVHLLYVIPSDGVDRALDRNGTIAGTVASWNAWLGAQTGGAVIRLDTCGGALDISFLRLARTDAQVRSMGRFARDEIERGVRAAGFVAENKIYLAYYDGTTLDASCGAAPWPPTRRFNVTAIYLRGEFSRADIPPCASNPIASAGSPPGYIELSGLHEVFHTAGAVPACAPHANDSHVGDDPRDLMYAGDQPWVPSMLDPGRDDYYGHGRSDCYDLARSPFLSPSRADAAYPPSW